MKRPSLPTRLAVGFLLVAVLPLIGLAWFYLHTFEQALTATVLRNTASITDKKFDQIEGFIRERLADVQDLAGQDLVQEALRALAADYRRGGLAATWQEARRLRHRLASFDEGGIYHDILLIDDEGNVIFSLRGEPDLGTNLRQGPYRDTGLAAGFQQAMTFLLSDLSRFEPYAPSRNEVAAFAVAPILDANRPIGALALQVNLATLMPVVADQTGLGTTGETVLARRDPEGIRYTIPLARLPGAPFTRVLPIEQAAKPMLNALMGRKGHGLTRDYVGVAVAASWTYLPALGWGMVVKMDAAEALAPLYAARRVTLLSLAGFLLLSASAAFLLGRRLVRGEGTILAQEARYRAMLGSMNEGVALFRPLPDDGDFLVLDINPAGERIVGARREASLGRTARGAFPALAAAGFFAAFDRVQRDGGSETMTLAAQPADRAEWWLENEVTRLPDGELLAVFRDITARKQAEEALARSLAQLRDAQRLARLGKWTLDLRQDRLEWSGGGFRIFEVNPGCFGARYADFLAAIHPDDSDRVHHAFQESLANHQAYAITHRLLFADGRVKYVQEHGETRYAEDGTPLVSHGTVQDITELRRAEEALELYANIFEHSGEAILVTDQNQRIMAVNPAFTHQTGYRLEDIAGQSPRVLASDRQPPETLRAMWRAIAESGYWQGELWNRNRNGDIEPKWAAISAIRDGRGAITHYIAAYTDISERKAHEARIEHLAHHDSLTGLFNRYNLEIRLSQALLTAHREGTRVAVLFIDLDRFKVINDTLGHHVGDRLLVEVAQRLRGCIRENDIVARPGGDEFVLVLIALDSPEQATRVAARILHDIGEPYDILGHRLYTSPSIGISLYPEDGADAESLMKNADTAMYHAKEQGRNNLQYFTPALNAAASERLSLERELRIALAEDQFQLFYQPQIAADADPRDPPCAMEALIRWRHPQRGLVPPASFIPIAEETGLIQPLGDWVLEAACACLASWRAAGLGPRRVAVNLSLHQLRDPALVAKVAASLERHGLGEGDLEIEITETVLMSDPAHAIEMLQALRALGLTIAIDDFGTGYSSLAYLKRLPIQVLKLDREFVRDIEFDENDAAISAATLALAHGLGLKVVAEGIENPAQSAFLRRHGCDYLQGYLYGKPESAAYWTERWRAERRARGQG